MTIKTYLNKDINILMDIKLELNEAARSNPCPGCKYDTKLLAKFVSIKLNSMKNGSSINKNKIKFLKEVDYINELTDIAIFFSKLIKPITITKKIPEVYKNTLRDDRESNKRVRTHLLKAKKLVISLNNKDKHFIIILEVLNAFIRATEFKLSVDPYTFYIFDKIIRIGYKTHLLSASSKIIVGTKRIMNPSRYM